MFVELDQTRFVRTKQAGNVEIHVFSLCVDSSKDEVPRKEVEPLN
jgi:hypothetical protein